MEQTPILVTGGCGFLGTAIVAALLETKRYAVTAIDITPPSLGSATFTDNVRYVRCDVLDPEALAKTFKDIRPTMVVHTVGVYPLGVKRYSMEGKATVFQINIEGTRNVIKASKECGAKGLVYTSSIAAVLDELSRDFRNVDETWPRGKSITTYGMSKAMSEELVLSANTHDFVTCVLRPAPIFGPNDAVCIPIIHACIAAGQTPFVLGAGNNLQDFVYVNNVADAHVLAVGNLLNTQTAAGEVFFVSNDEPIMARDLCLAIWKEFDHVPTYQVSVPEGVAWWLGCVAEWVNWLVGAEGEFCRGIVSDGCRYRYVNLAKAKQVLGYHPRVGMEEGLRISCRDYRNRIESKSKH